MADRDLQAVLNSGLITNIFIGGTTADDRVLKLGELNALNLSYDNSTSGLTATNVQAAVDETALTVGEITTAVSIVSNTPLATQTLVADTPEKLEWATSTLVDSGGTSIVPDLPNHNIAIGSDGIYKIYGVISALAPINDIVNIELRIDNVETGFSASCIGRGAGSRITFTYAFMTPLTVALSPINLWVESTGTSIDIQSASVTVEKTPY